MTTERAQLKVSHRYPVPADKIFDAFLDPAKARHFFFATETGEMIKSEIDPRVGGKYVMIDKRPEMGEVEHAGEYLEISRPKKLSFTFGLPKLSPEIDTVTLEFSPKGGGCEVVLTYDYNARFKSSEDKIVSGWRTVLQGVLPSLTA